MQKRLDLHEDFRRDEEVVGSSDRNFGLVFAAVFSVVGAVRWWLGHASWEFWLAGAAVFLILALLIPAVLAPLNKAWRALGLLLHKIVNPIVMGFLFVFCIVPMGLVMRAFGKDFLNLRIDRDAASYWVKRYPTGIAPDTMKNQF